MRRSLLGGIANAEEVLYLSHIASHSQGVYLKAALMLVKPWNLAHVSLYCSWSTRVLSIYYAQPKSSWFILTYGTTEAFGRCSIVTKASNCQSMATKAFSRWYVSTEAYIVGVLLGPKPWWSIFPHDTSPGLVALLFRHDQSLHCFDVILCLSTGVEQKNYGMLTTTTQDSKSCMRVNISRP